MKSTNFEFLRPKRPALADLGAFAERYLAKGPHQDIASGLTKLRLFVEEVVAIVYDEDRLRSPYDMNLNERMRHPEFREVVATSVQHQLHALRRVGNKGAHGDSLRNVDAMAVLRDAYDVGVWLHEVYNEGSRRDAQPFETPTESASTMKAQLKREKRELKQALSQREARERELQASLEEKEAALEAALAEAKEARAANLALARTTETERAQAKARSEATSSALGFDEHTTRLRLIDTMLRDAGWDVGSRGESTDEVGQEVRVDGLPTESGEGYADYVLWGNDGKPLAVVEAKRARKDPNDGCVQAQQYADALETRYNQRPVIFCTNGYQVLLWDDAPTLTRSKSLPPRLINGFYAKASLERLIHKRTQAEPLETIAPSKVIAGRIYQIEAIKRVMERFSNQHRQALIVQATGTGKTRVAISLTEALIRAHWVKRVLFLCDRVELRKQALDAFKDHLSDPRTIVTRATAQDRTKRIYLATYPSMMGIYTDFDPGFFDLVIADESHRSIYNKYGDLFRHFDALQVGLTATPVRFLDRNTYRLFGCGDQDPTAHFSLTEAINAVPPYLVPMRVKAVTTGFQREGIRWSQLDDEQQRELESQLANAEDTDYDAKDLDKAIFNRETTRGILRNLMEHGIRDAEGQLPGKSIIFARNHKHAMHLAEVFAELYPSYGGSFCQVIDSHNARAGELLEAFKDPKLDPRIAVSVDMLDTGINVPEIVNLVFAKPVKSYVKFWQMIGRGTRLCEDLFGPGKHKTEFLIFDHWGNFAYFDEHYEEKLAPPPKGLMQRLFEARIALAQGALEATKPADFDTVIALIRGDLEALKATKAIAVREQWQLLETLTHGETLADFDAPTVEALTRTVAPLMRWIDLKGHEAARRFDLLMAETQLARLTGSSAYDDLRGKVQGHVEALRKNLNQVKAKAASIAQVREPSFWAEATVGDLEAIRDDLRSVMQYQRHERTQAMTVTEIDISDGDESRVDVVPTFQGQELLAYRQRVEGVLRPMIDHHPVLARIRAGHQVTDAELESLAQDVLLSDPGVHLRDLPKHLGMATDLHHALRSIVGLDVSAVDDAFTGFVHAHPRLTPQQLRFLQMLKTHLVNNGTIHIDRLYETPFTTLSSEGIDGVFSEALVTELLTLVAPFELSSHPDPDA